MSISSALFSGVSGLNTLGNSMSVIGDNIANVNTIGFKASRATFETLLAQNISGAAGTSQVGRGVAMSAVDYVWDQGSFEGTNQATDMAIGGQGFFMVRSPETGMFYTRAGHFLFDEEGYLVNPSGYRVQGWILEPDSSDPRGAITDIQINATSSSPAATENVDIAVNLDTTAEFIESSAFVESSESTRSGFVFDDGANDVLILDDAGSAAATTTGNMTIDLVTGVAGSPLIEGTVYTGDEVAQAIEDQLNSGAVGAQNGYTVSYDNTTNIFSVTVTGGTDLIVVNNANSTTNDIIGFGTAANETVTNGAGAQDGEEVAFNVTDENNAFTVTVDGTTATVQLTNGVYTITEMRRHLEEQINTALGATSGEEIVDVRYDDSASTRNRFQIFSSIPGENSQIQMTSVDNNFLPTINIVDYELQTAAESEGYSEPGFTESMERLTSGFIFTTNNDDLWLDGGAVDLNGATDGTTTFAYNTVYSGDTVAAFLENTLGADFTVSYNEVTDRFNIVNTSTNNHTINWTNANSTLSSTLGFSSTTDVASNQIIAGAQVDSVKAVAFNVITGVNDSLDIIVNGNPSNSGTAVSVTIDAGAYTGSELATELEDEINDALDDAGEEETVDVTYNEVNETLGGRFRIASSDLGSSSTMRLINFDNSPPASDLVGGTLNMDDDTINYGRGFRVDQPDDSANYSTSLVVYDTLGNQHTVTFYFRKAEENELDNRTTWEWFAYLPASETASGEAEVQARGTMVFDQTGLLRSESETEWLTTTTDSNGNTVDGEGFNFSSGAEPQQIIDIGYGLGSDVNVSTQFSAPSSTIFQTQDGFGSGFLQSVSVDSDGVVSGNYSNGQVLFLARVALANFTNPWGLSREGGNLFSETRVSGQPITGTAGSAGLGTISPNSLEQSNVDISTEFVNMIIQQRGFQANSRIITTTDDMLAELINLKR